MHALRLRAPGVFESVPDAPDPDPQPGQVTVHLSTAALCGSDLPKFRATADPRSGRIGFPVHECVGRIADSGRNSDLHAGQRVLAMPADDCGLAEIYLAHRDGVYPIRAAQLTDAQATLIQPLSTVLYAIDRLSRLVAIADAQVAILGLGPIGLLCAHVLSRRGARILGVDPIARSDDVATAFGVTDHLQDSAAAWPGSSHADQPIDICVEAVGHQQRTLRDAVALTRHGGTILAMGVPDDSEYAFPYEMLLRKNLTLTTSITPPWQEVFGAAEDYLCTHLDTLSRLLTTVFPITDAAGAYRRYATPSPDRLKVLLSTDTGWTRSEEPA